MATTLDRYRLLGRSGLRVSPLSLGTMTFGVTTGWGTSDAEAAEMVARYVDAGGNFIDTANFYGELGGSERVLAPLLKGRRERIVLSTKYTMSMAPGDPNASGNHRKNMVQAVEASLKRLDTDYIDLLYLHMWDGLTPVDEILRAFDDLVRSGKVLYAGLSDIPAWQASRMQAIADLRGWTPFVALQIAYNLTERTVERELIPMGREMGMGVIPWSPLAGGVLSGKYSRADLVVPDAASDGQDDLPRKAINLATGRLSEKNLDIVDAAKAVAADIGCSIAQVALAWTLLNPGVTSPIIGARTLAQLEDNLAALDITFSDDHIRRLDAASAIAMGFPHDILSMPMAQTMLGTLNVEPRRP
ncbi:aldo/keto reductase [Sphingobium sufflavum]|uniref:aldo/keto reductase n=1 Tax=Sphingobium sufflavum TaxID=1129547 RepID=UPI001F44B879|nr:aldo/keto reductase [Sphingobium sufflavum]MCE7797762.1 aldo/keto reductase [Sphingobium sufflavum]